MDKQKTSLRVFRAPLVASGLVALTLPSFAAIDVTAATAGITEAQTAVLAVLAAMITMGVAVWGVRKVLKFFRT